MHMKSYIADKITYTINNVNIGSYGICQCKHGMIKKVNNNIIHTWPNCTMNGWFLRHLLVV